jgi:hypothetical protein
VAQLNETPLVKDGEPGGARTRDHRIKSAMLYQLSYRPKLFIYNNLEWIMQNESFWNSTIYSRCHGDQTAVALTHTSHFDC